MNKIYLAFITVLFICPFITAEGIDSSAAKITYPVIIDSITLSGNDITDDDIITRELTFAPGDTLNKELADYNKERIFSLGIFTKVEFSVHKQSGKNILNIHVDEGWYIYPIPFVQLKDKDWNKLSYGFYAVIKNFRGRNESITGKAEFGYDPSFTLSYYKPSLGPGSRIFMQFDLVYQNVNNVSNTAKLLHGEKFEQKNIAGQVTAGKRFGLFNWFSINAAYNYIETPFYTKGISASDSRIDRFPSAGFMYKFDNRDLIQFPKNGMYFGLELLWKGFGINSINHGILNLDFREYRKLWGDLHGKWRFSSKFTMGGLIPYYDYSRLGSSEKIRGHYHDDMEGNHLYISSFELYHPIIKDLNLSFEWIPLIPNQLLRYRVALYSQLFVETGAVQQRTKKLGLNNFNSGYGGGLTLLILPYNLLRFEYGLDEFNNGEFIIDLGVSF